MTVPRALHGRFGNHSAVVFAPGATLGSAGACFSSSAETAGEPAPRPSAAETRSRHAGDGTTDYASGAKGRLAKYTDRPGGGQQNMIPVYCSEYVMLSYQLAANGDTNAPSPHLRLDAGAA
jgi:hypothetical protein